jgi:hypothetical protein
VPARSLTRKCSRQAGLGRRSVRAGGSSRPSSGSVDSCGREDERLQLICISLGGHQRAMVSYRVCPLPLAATTGWRRRLAQIAGLLLPKQDPDFYLQSESVAYWWLELHDCEARRELGFTADGTILRFAPSGRNWGVFVGEEVALRDLGASISQAEFDAAWSRARRQWPHLDSSPGAA